MGEGGDPAVAMPPATLTDVLPDELLLLLLSFLDQQDIVALHLVNRRLLRLAEDDAVWRRVFMAKYPEQLHDRTFAQHRWKERLRLIHTCWHRGRFTVRHHLSTLALFGGIRFASFAQDNEDLIVAGSTKGHIVLWNLGNDRDAQEGNRKSQGGPSHGSVEQISAHSQWVRCVIRRGDHIISASSDHTVQIWSLSTRERLHYLSAHSDQVNLVKLMPDPAGSVAESTSLLSASDDKTINQWDIERGVCVRTFEGHTGWVLAMDCNSHTIASAGNQQPIMIWDARSGLVRSIPFSGTTRFLQFDDHTLALGGDSLLQFRDVRKLEVPMKKIDVRDTVWTLQLSGSRVVTGGDKTKLKQWDINTGECRFTLDGSREKGVQSVQFSSTRIVSASLSGHVLVWGPDFSRPL